MYMKLRVIIIDTFRYLVPNWPALALWNRLLTADDGSAASGPRWGEAGGFEAAAISS